MIGLSRETQEAFESIERSLEERVKGWMFWPLYAFAIVLAAVVGAMIGHSSAHGSPAMRDIGNAAAERANIIMQEREQEIERKDSGVWDYLQRIDNHRATLRERYGDNYLNHWGQGREQGMTVEDSVIMDYVDER